MLKYLTHHVPDGFTTNMIRYPIATIVYLPLLVSTVRRGRPLGRFWITALIPAIVNIISQTLFAIAPYYMNAGVMSFLLRLSTIWSILLAFLLFADERPLARSRLFWSGAVIGLAGFLLMAIYGNPEFRLTTVGILIVLVCSLFWGLYDVTVRHTMAKLHPLVVFGVIGNYTSIGLLFLGPIGEPSSILRLAPWPFALLVISAFIGISAAHGMYYVAIQRLGVAVPAIVMLATPFVSIIVSATFLGERFTGLQWIGGFALLGGAALALISRQRMRRRELPEPP
jgi:drug/metabolite transporter (DMT)-like permease